MGTVLGERTASSDILEAISELEQSTPEALKRLRSHARLNLRVKLIAQPADASRRHELKVQGVTGDISEGGAKVLFPIPMRVGDLYWLTFDQSALDVPPVFGRCVRCRYVREDAYESGFRFLQPLDLSGPSEET